MDFLSDPIQTNIKPNLNPSELKPTEVYFYEQPNGNIIPLDERSAWDVHKKFKQVGVSDGRTYFQGIKEAHKIFAEHGLAKAQEHLREALKKEIEVARGKFKTPKNFDVFGDEKARAQMINTGYGR